VETNLPIGLAAVEIAVEDPWCAGGSGIHLELGDMAFLVERGGIAFMLVVCHGRGYRSNP
jgi:hypothetical protein